MIKKSLIDPSPVLKGLMMNELEVLQKISHPNILNAVSLFEDDTHYYVATEFCPGGELLDRLIS